MLIKQSSLLLYATVMMAVIIQLCNYNPFYLPQCLLFRKKTKLKKIIITRSPYFLAKVVEELKNQGPCPQKNAMPHKMDLGRNKVCKSRHAALKPLPNPLGS